MTTTLHERIRREMAERGPRPFREFMEQALYDPEHGYYAAGKAQIGRRGDFFTNVSVGPLFGKLCARAFAERWRQMGEPAEFTIVEQGAHGGEFAEDALAGLRECAPACAGAVRYLIVEPSAALREAQRRRLAGHPVRWDESLEALPSFAGVHFSNELPDAFPVSLVRWSGGKWHERHVTEEGGRLAFCDGPLSSAELEAACREIPLPLPDGYTTEVNLPARTWMADVARKLTRGEVMVIDYGYERGEYYAPERVAGTLSAYAQHRRVADPLAAPGTIDLTAHVEFTSLIEAGTRAGLTLREFTDQHHFMVRLGMEYFAEGGTARERRAFTTLMHPQFMGRSFRVLRMERV